MFAFSFRDGAVLDYEGDRSKNAIVQFARKALGSVTLFFITAWFVCMAISHFAKKFVLNVPQISCKIIQ